MTTISTTIRAGRDRRRPSRVLTALAAVIAGLATPGTALADPKPTPDPASYISKDVRAKMAAQAPLKAAASRIQWSVERGDATGYAGIGLGAGEVVVWWKGALPQAVDKTIADARRTTPVRVVAAAHSRAELEAAATGIAKQLRADPRSPYHSVDIPYDGNGLIVNTELDQAVTTSLPATMRAARTGPS